jgi:hypothetical protein
LFQSVDGEEERPKTEWAFSFQNLPKLGVKSGTTNLSQD